MKCVVSCLSGVRDNISGGLLLLKDTWRWLRIWRSIPVYEWLKAAEAFRRGEYHKSAECYKRGLLKHSSHPAHFSARFDLSYCLQQTGELEEALGILSEITDKRYPMLEAYLNKANLLYYLGRHSLAIDTIKTGLSIFPNSSSLICSFINISLISGIAQDELKLLISELNLLKDKFKNHSNSDIEVAIAHFELVLGDEEKGDKILISALCNDNVPVEAYIIRGKRLFSQGKFLQARELFRRAMLIAPLNPYPVILLSESYLNSNNPHEISWAIQLAETAGRISKWKNIEAVELLGRAYEKNQEKEKAELFHARIRKMSQAALFPLRKKGRDIMLGN